MSAACAARLHVRWTTLPDVAGIALQLAWNKHISPCKLLYRTQLLMEKQCERA